MNPFLSFISGRDVATATITGCASSVLCRGATKGIFKGNNFPALRSGLGVGFMLGGKSGGK